MQQHALVAVGQLEGLAGLVGRPALDVAQRDDEPLCDWELLDRRANHGPGLTRDEAYLGVTPGERRARPAAGVARIVVRQEALGVHGWVVALGFERCERRERPAAALAHG